jgi:hypothetical protein
MPGCHGRLADDGCRRSRDCAYSSAARHDHGDARPQTAKREGVMSKGMDQKKNQKKEPTKTLKEKRAAKQEKKKQ